MAGLYTDNIQGLKQFSDLTPEEQNKYYKEHSNWLDYSTEKKNQVYKNIQFRERFKNRSDYDILTTLSPEARNTFYYNDIIQEEFGNKYGNEKDYDYYHRNLSIQGMVDWLNAGIKTEEEINEPLQSELERQKINENNFWIQLLNNIQQAELKVNPNNLRIEGLQTYVEQMTRRNDAEKQRILAEDNKRKASECSDLAFQYVNELNNNLNSGEINEDTIEQMFSNIAESPIGGSRYYKAFKDRDEFENFNTGDKKKIVAMVNAIANKYGEESAINWLDTYMQEYVNGQQTAGDWIANSFGNGIPTKFVASAMNDKLMLQSLYILANKGKKAYENFIAGKDEYGNELPKWSNVQFWGDAYAFNTFDTDEINKIRENGGISPYINVTKPGEEFSNVGNAMLSAAEQSGNVIWELTKQYALGVGFRGIGKLSGAKLSGSIFNSSTHTLTNTKFSNIVSKVGHGLQIISAGNSEAMMETGMVYKETYEQLSELMNDEIYKEAMNYVNSLQNTSSFQQMVSEKREEILNTLVQRQKQELSKSSEFQLNISDDELKKQLYTHYKDSIDEQAVQSVKHSLAIDYTLTQEGVELGDKKEKDARKAAMTAAMSTLAIFKLRNIADAVNFQRWIFDKGTRKDIFGNRFLNNIGRNGDVAVRTTLEKNLEIAKEIGKQIGGGFLSEFNDSVTENFSKGLGLGMYNDVVAKRNNPEIAANNIEFMSSFMAGLDRATTDGLLTLTDKQAWYEGFIGALSPVTNIIPVATALSKDNRGQSFRTDKDGNRISFAESLSKFIMNPLVSSIADVNREYREAQSTIDAVNDVIAKHKDDIEHINDVLYNLTANQVTRRDENQSLLEAKDAKVIEGIELISTLTSLMNDPVAQNSELVANAYDFLNKLAEDKLDKEEMDKLIFGFLNSAENKDVSTTEENPQQFARERLISNAKQLIEIQKTIQDVSKEIQNSELDYKLKENEQAKNLFLTNIVLNKNFRQRFNEIESQLSGQEVQNAENREYQRNALADYSTAEGWKATYESEQKTLQDLKSQLDDIYKELKKAETSEQKESLRLRLNKVKSEIKEQKQKITEIEKDKSLFYDENGKKIENPNNHILTEEEIMALSPEQRFLMISVKHKNGFYSQQQEDIIDNLISKLKSTGNDKLEAIKDSNILYQRIKDTEKAQSLMADNIDAAIMYINHAHKERAKHIQDVITNRLYKDYFEFLDSSANDEELMQRMKSLQPSSHFLSKYLERHKKKQNLFENYQKLVALSEDAVTALQEQKLDKDKYTLFATLISQVITKSEDIESAINNLEELVDSLGEDGKIFDEVLNRLEKLNYARNSTKVLNRQEEKKKKDEIGRQLEEEKKQREKRIQEAVHQDTEQKETKKQQSEDKKTDVSDSEQQTESQVSTISTSALRKQDEELSSNSNGLVGNAFYEYDTTRLNSGDKVQVRKVPQKDTLRNYFEWLDKQGIHLQDIIDKELYDIITNNPDYKIHFLFTKPQQLKDKSDTMQNIIFEVIEYTPNVAKYHKEERGGVITVDGKQWLIIGTLGYNMNNKAQMESHHRLQNEMLLSRKKYFDENPNSSYYVNTDFYTKVANIQSGSLSRKLITDKDDANTVHSIGELLRERNPYNLTWKDLRWGIVREDLFQTIGVTSSDVIYAPGVTATLGGTYLLVPTSNGNYIPAYVKPKMISEINNGELKTRIYTLLNELLSLDYNKRLNAVKELRNYIVLNDVNDISIGSEKDAALYVKSKGVQVQSFDLRNDTESRMKFIDLINSLPFRINITPFTLSSVDNLKLYSEAGALDLDIAELATTNASYNVYDMDENGEPIITEITYNPSSREKKYEFHYIIKGKDYRQRNGVWYDESDKPIDVNDVKNQQLLLNLTYGLKILKNELKEVKIINNNSANRNKGKYYQLNNNSQNPKFIKVVDGNVYIATDEESQKMVEYLNKKMKESAIKQEIQSTKEIDASNAVLTDISDIMFKDTESSQEPNNVNLVSETDISSIFDDIQIGNEQKPNEVVDDSKRKTIEVTNISTIDLENRKNSITFASINSNRDYRTRLNEIAKEKNWNWGSTAVSKEAFLKGMNISTEGITNIEDFLNMLKECK